MAMPDWLNPNYRPASDHGWRAYWFRVIFLHGKADERRFDVILLFIIGASVGIAVLDSVAAIHAIAGKWFYVLEWVFTLLFTIEYVVRLLIVRSTLRYATSFYGLIDLAALLPTFISLAIPGADHLIVIRVLRVLRVFKILELVDYSQEGSALVAAIYSSRKKIGLFLFCVLLVTLVFGAFMFLIEGPENGFTSIPRSMYWAIVTMATVGFGDITPKTPLGQFMTSIIVLIGYGLIAVPTGIFGSHLLQHRDKLGRGRLVDENSVCPRCSENSHQPSPNYCHRCGEPFQNRNP